MPPQSLSAQDFKDEWDGCIIEKLNGILGSLPNGEALQDAIDTLFAAIAVQDLSGMLEAALGQLMEESSGTAEPIITVLTLELKFLCNDKISSSSGSPLSNHDKASKAKIILTSLLAILPLRPEARRLLHLLIELLDLAQ